MNCTFSTLMNELGCRDTIDRHLFMVPPTCPHCHKILSGKIYDHAGIPIAETGGLCARLTFIIAGHEFNACFEKTHCPFCLEVFLQRMEMTIECYECREDVRIGMISFDKDYISGFSVVCSGKNSGGSNFEVSLPMETADDKRLPLL